MSELAKKEENVTRVQRFVALRGGEFWKANQSDEDRYIDEGEVLMISAVDIVDDKAHTIHVRLHPSKVGGFRFEACFLVDDFMDLFDWVSQSEAESVRKAEVEAIQQRLSEEQDNLTTACADPQLMDKMIAEDAQEPEVTEDSSNLPVAYKDVGVDVVEAIQTQKVTSLMQTGLTEARVDNIKVAMNAQRDIAVKRADWLQSRTELLSEIATELTPYFKERAAVALAASKDMRDHVDALMKGIGNLNLYVLKNVETDTLVKGKSAKKNEKLTITQRVLYIDEELAVYEHIDDQFDCNDREIFYEALAEHKSLVDQIFPSRRCVVAIATTRKLHNYQDRGYSQQQAEALTRENQRRLLLVRDGDNIHLVFSPELWHQTMRTLFPTATERNAPFKGFDGREITYRDLEYTSALEKHEVIALGYKRMLILLCGLDHNLKLFGDFYPGEASFDFMSQEFQEKYFKFIFDVEGSTSFPSHCPVSINDWAKSLNNEMSSGSRVIMVWHSMFSHRSIPGAFERENLWNTRSGASPEIQYEPVDDKDGFIEGHLHSQAGELVMEIPVEGQTLHDFKDRTFNAKLNVSIASRTAEPFQYLCVDRLNVDDARFYLHHRPSRDLNVRGIRLLKRAIALAEVDRQYEMPVRDSLLKALNDAGVEQDEDAALRLIDDGLARYRCAHPKTDVLLVLENKKAFNEICDYIFQLSGTGRQLVSEIKEAEEKVGRTVKRITLLANGQHCAYSTPLSDEVDDRMLPFGWDARTRYKALKKGVSGAKPTFKSGIVPSSETLVYQSTEHPIDVNRSNQVFKSPKAKAAFLDIIEESEPRLMWEKIHSMKSDRQSLLEFIDDYEMVRRDYSRTCRMVVEPSDIIVLGATVGAFGGLRKFGLACLSTDIICWLVSDDEELSEKYAAIHSKKYQQGISAKERTLEAIAEMKGKSAHEIMTLVTLPPDEEGGFFQIGGDHGRISDDKYKKYSFDATIAKLKNKKNSLVYLNPDLSGSIDEWLEISKPEGFHPHFYLDDGFGEDSVLDLFECTDKSIKKLDGYLRVIESYDEAVERFGVLECEHHTDDSAFDVSYEWVPVKPRKYRGIVATKSFNYKETKRVEIKDNGR